MKALKIVIEKNPDGFWAYAENENGIIGGGDTVQACKQDILDCIDTLKEVDAPNRPEFLNAPYQIVYRFDTQSLFAFYKGIFTNAALEKLTGINQKQLQHYASGHRKPRINQLKKIQHALHQLGQELIAVEI
jgi:hypothetical protein